MHDTRTCGHGILLRKGYGKTPLKWLHTRIQHR